MSDMKTDLSRVRGLGSAKKGTHHFWIQRLTALALIPLSVFFVVGLLKHLDSDYDMVMMYLSHPVVAIILLLLIVSGVWHMFIGMQVVIEDYIHHPFGKKFALILNNFFAVVISISCVFTILKLAL